MASFIGRHWTNTKMAGMWIMDVGSMIYPVVMGAARDYGRRKVP